MFAIPPVQLRARCGLTKRGDSSEQGWKVLARLVTPGEAVGLSLAGGVGASMDTEVPLHAIVY